MVFFIAQQRSAEFIDLLLEMAYEADATQREQVKRTAMRVNRRKDGWPRV